MKKFISIDICLAICASTLVGCQSPEERIKGYLEENLEDKCYVQGDI